MPSIGTGTLPTLQQLGITHTLNADGQAVWTLKLSEGNSSQALTAYFDESYNAWRVVDKNDAHRVPGLPAPTTSLTRPLNGQQLNDAGTTSDSWYDALPQDEHSAFFISVDWAATPLGCLKDWPHALRIHTHTLFADRRPGSIYWGPQRAAIYNSTSVPLMGPLHPQAMGQPFKLMMPGLWEFFGPMFKSLETDGKGLVQHSLEVPLERYGYLEESYWDGGLSSLKDDSGNHGGVCFSWTEVTRTVLRDRRTALVNKLAQLSDIDVQYIWQHMYDTFAQSPREAPMALFYSADTDKPTELQLRHFIGITAGRSKTIVVGETFSIEGTSSIARLCSLAQESAAGFLTFDLNKDEFDPDLFLDELGSNLFKEELATNPFKDVSWAGHGYARRHVLVICLKTRDVVKGYVILGLNPLRDLDDDHKQFLSEVARQLNESMTRVAMADISRQRELNLKQALTDSERLMSKLVQMAPVGIYELSIDGTLTWANRHFFDVFGVPRDKRDPALFNWHDHILPEDQQKANIAMGRSIMEREEISDALRLNKRWKPPGITNVEEHKEEPYWILYSASPDIIADGSVRALMGCITNISHLKWAEVLQARNAETAQKERRRQEEFIDVISHEMRNPLSAITQCADSILTSLHDVTAKSDRQILMDVITHNAEAAESVSFCASHQKRIIDDVLALSKLDSGLLTINPIPFRFDRLVGQTLQMFKGEFAASTIDVRILSDTLDVPLGATIQGDSARLTQIIVNLLTNAIKFTRTEETRTIMIRYGLSHTPPKEELFGDVFKWQSTNRNKSDSEEQAKLSDNVAIYPYFSVSDSGKGIAGDSTERVFCKFEQADQKTYVNYGGSGLGLYISRELAEIQGGHIGIESAAAVGSTFAFYTKAKRSSKHPVHVDNSSVQDGTTLVKKRRLSTGLRILLVEDNLLNQRVLARLLVKAGCVVHVANHGGEAIDFVLQTLKRPAEYGSAILKEAPDQFDCILMDWEMPICNGLDATKRIREVEVIEDGPENVIIGITANAREDQIATALQAGMDSVLSKPFRIDDVLTRVQEVLKTKVDARNSSYERDSNSNRASPSS